MCGYTPHHLIELGWSCAWFYVSVEMIKCVVIGECRDGYEADGPECQALHYAIASRYSKDCG